MKKIALPSNDRLTIARQTGRASEFVVVTLNDNMMVESQEYRINNHHHEHDHDEHKHEAGHNHDDLATLISDCQNVLVQHAGPHFKESMEKSGIAITFIESLTLEDAIIEFSKA